jgi:hypothetical protein
MEEKRRNGELAFFAFEAKYPVGKKWRTSKKLLKEG